MRSIALKLGIVALALSSLLADFQSEELISAEEAIKLIDKPGVKFVNGDSEDSYGNIHIKGSAEMFAHHLHHSDITGKMHCTPLYKCPSEAEEYVGKKGINNNTLVIAYDDFKGPNATGVWHFFKMFGHDKVKILNGGIDALYKVSAKNSFGKILDKLDSNTSKFVSDLVNNKEENYAKIRGGLQNLAKNSSDEKVKKLLEGALDETNSLFEKGHEPEFKKETFKIDPTKIDLSIAATKEDVLKASNDILQNGDKSNYVIIDTRRMVEIIGENKLDNVARGGHVPGSKFIEWKHFSDDKNRMTYKDLADMQALLDKHGVTKDKTVYTYCHVGAGRSSYEFTVMKMLGYDNVKVYTGSWDEWGNDPELPVRR